MARSDGWEDPIQVAQAELDDLRKVVGVKDADDKQRAFAGQKRALQYLQGGVEIMATLGYSMIGAVLAAVGPAYFEASFEKWRKQADEWNDHEGWFWKEIAQYLKTGEPVSALLASVFAAVPQMDKEQLQTWSDGLRMAYCLIEEDEVLRECLVVTDRKEEEKEMTERAPQKSQTMMLRDTEKSLASSKVAVADAARALALLPVPSRALAIASTFIDAIDQALPGDVEMKAEQIGRRLEKVLEETGREQTDVLLTMIESGDIDVVLAMVRGNAGDYSSTAEHLTASLCRAIFKTDSDMNSNVESGSTRRASRLVTIAHTLIVETDAERTPEITRFFSSRSGKSLLAEICQLANDGDDDAVTILTAAKDREIVIPGLISDSEDELDED